MLRGIGRLRAGGSGFSPSQITFTSGLWLDPSDISTGYQDSAGTTPQTASGQPTGRRLDKSQALALGANIIPTLADRTFSSDTGFWGKDPGVTISGGFCNFSAATTGNALFKGSGAVAGSYYDVTWTIASISAGSLRINGGGGSYGATKSAPGTYTERIYTAAGGSFGVYVASGPCTAAVSLVSIAPVLGNHVVQSTAASRPEYDVLSGISSDFLDGSNDGYSTATGLTLVNGMDLFVALNRSSTGNMIPISEAVASATKFIGAMQAATSTSGSAAAGVGSAWTCYVNGVQVGGTATTTAAQLNTAMGSGAYKVLEFRDLDLSAWTQFTFGLYTSNMYGGDDAQLVLCPAQSSATRDKLRTYVGAKAGLTL